MKIVFSKISQVFDTEIDAVNTIVIENQSLLYEICMDIYRQIQGDDGSTVVSIEDKPVALSKNTELITQFIPFEINKKGLLSKLSAVAEKLANDPDYYEATLVEMSNLEKYFYDITENMLGGILFSKLSIGNIIKSAGLEFEDDYASLGEKIIDYMEFVREYDKDKLFVFVDLRSFISDDEIFDFFDTALRKNFHMLLLESKENVHCKNEKCYIVDKDYCEIG